MDKWLENLTNWIAGLVRAIFEALVTFVHDAALWVFDGILQALAALIVAIPVPSFMTGGSVASLLGGFPAFALYVLAHLNIGACFAVLSAGITFRLLRKAGTLGQW